jgi:hypothetical protein
MSKLKPEDLDFFRQEFEEHPEAVLFWSSKAMARTTSRGFLRGVISEGRDRRLMTFIPVIGKPAKSNFDLDTARAVTYCKEGIDEEASLVLRGIGFGKESADSATVEAVNGGGFINEAVSRSAQEIATPFVKTEPMPIDQQVAQLLIRVVVEH